MHNRISIFLLGFLFLFVSSAAGVSFGQSEIRSPDTLVLCSRNLVNSLAPWLKHRRRQGHEIVVHYSGTTVAQNKKLIAHYAKSGKLKNILLVGDSGDRWLDRRKIVPTNLIPAKVNQLFGSERKIATDNPYADLDEDGIPEFAIGRLTADTPKELSDTIARIIRYENQTQGRPWQRNINLIAGVGGFGKLIDTVIENTTREIITELIPAGYQTSMTYGSWTSPYCPDPRKFSQTAIKRFNDGCLFWVYCGHGNRYELDRILLPEQHYRILDSELVKKLDCQNGSPIAICLSCYTGAHDGNNDCLAEFMMRQTNGPVAVLCGSRVTMPYAMSVLSVEMMNEFFNGDCQSLGELVLSAKQRMLKKTESEYRRTLDSLGKTLSPLPAMLEEECREHVQLMQLIGDPLLRLKRPKQMALKLASDENQDPPVFSQGETITVQGTAPHAGTLQLEVAYKRGRLRYRPELRGEYDSSHESLSKMQEDFLKAQDPVCTKKLVNVAPGDFSIQLIVPRGCRGDCDVRATLLGGPSLAIDSTPLRIKSDRQARKRKGVPRTASRADKN